MSAALHSLSRTRASLAARVCLRCAHARTFASVPSSDWEGVPASSRPASPSTTAPGSGSVRHSVSQGAVQFVPRDVTPELVRRIGEREAELRANYDALPAACGDVASRAEALRKRLLYRSKQRGWCVFVGAVVGCLRALWAVLGRCWLGCSWRLGLLT